MKRLVFIVVVCSSLPRISEAQYASQTLDNLIAPTNVNTSLVPKGVNSLSLGAAAKPWKFVFLGSGVYLNNNLFMQTKTLGTTFLGANAGFNTTGTYNTGLGYKALYTNTGGIYNTAVGAEALYTTTAGYNTAVGYRTLYFNTTGTNNTAVGVTALRSNKQGIDNVAVGSNALYSNEMGSANVAIGTAAMDFNVSGGSNVAIGGYSLFHNLSGTRNIAIGHEAMFSNTTGTDNVALGKNTLRANLAGSRSTALGAGALENNLSNENTAAGYNAMHLNTSGTDNTAFGTNALSSNTTGGANTAVGFISLQYNTTGSSNFAGGTYTLVSNTTGSFNSVSGVASMPSSQTGNYNTAHGYSALYDNISGSYNVAVGSWAGGYIEGNDNNTAIGSFAGDAPTKNSTFLGYEAHADFLGQTLTNAMALGYQASVPGDNQVVIGNSSVTSIGGYANWTNFSDGRYKQNVQEDVPGLKFIQALRPVTYTLDINGIQQNTKNNSAAAKGRRQANTKQDESAAKSAQAKAKIVYTGFIGQEVEKAAESLHYDFSGVKKPANDKDFYGLRYSEFVVPLVKAVQELSAKTDSLEQKNAQLNSQNNKLEERIAALENILLSKNGVSLSDAAGVWLGQNVPNPSGSTTLIPFKLPQGTKSANILITEMGSGRNISTVLVTSSQQNVSVNVPSASGTYIYSLVVNGKVMESKKMVVVKK